VRLLSVDEVMELYARIIEQSGGSSGLRDLPALESCVGQPLQTFERQELYPSVVAKAAALAFFLVRNHPFVDGNKRIGHAALEVTLFLNGFEINASVDEQEQIMLALAASKLSREEFTTWVSQHLQRNA
jgi:death on curing protein